MATQVRQKRTGALIFNQNKDEKQQFADRKKIQQLEKELQILKEFIINKLEGQYEKIKEII